jgi:hypothetical protein
MDAIDSVWVNENAVLRKLSDFESITGRLEAGGRPLDAYDLDCKAGDQVRLRLTSDDFQAVAFVVLASSQGDSQHEAFVRMVTGSSGSTAGSVETQESITLPTGGVYRIVVTSLDNHSERKATSAGEYRMTLLLDTAGIASQQPLSGPESQKGPRFSAWESDGR